MAKTTTRKAAPARAGRPEHAFTLILSGLDRLSEAAVDALCEAGCNDAVIGMRGGVAFAAFDREATTLAEAIASAVRDVRRAGFDAARVEDEGLVSQADIARRMGRSRQLVNQYVSGRSGPGGFPAPRSRCGGASPLWAWPDVAAWLTGHGLLPPEELRRARVIETANAVLDFQRREREEPRLVGRMVSRMGVPPAIPARRARGLA